MTTAIILGISFVCMSILTSAKMSELRTGRNILHLSNPERDEKITESWRTFTYNITHVSRTSMKETSHKTIVAFENIILKVIMKVGKKFSSVGDIVRGKDIPRNRGSVSFFLKNLEEGKKSR